MKQKKFYPKWVEVGKGLKRFTRIANGRLNYNKLLTKLFKTGLPKVHGGEK